MPSQIVQGTSVAPGLAIGPVHVVHAGPSTVPTWTVSREDVPTELGRLAAALTVTAERLEERRRIVAKAAGEKDAGILAVHRMILEDPEALKTVEQTIQDERINAEAAVQKLIARFHSSLGELEGNNVRGFASDASDPWRGVLDTLLARDRQEILDSQARVVIAATELTPAVVTWLDRAQVLAIVCEAGGRFSHGAVLARSFGVPCVVGVPNLLNRLEQGMTLAVDGRRGTVQIRPTEEEKERFRNHQATYARRAAILQTESSEAAETPDGHHFSVSVNIESVRDLEQFDPDHVDGVGLFRTEFLYLERNQFPSEEEQYRLYRRVVEHMGGKPATLRLLDIGGDKPLPYFHTPPEPNPALGWRGIRITLQWRDLLRSQLRAFLRASPSGELRILVPMVSTLDELLTLRTIYREVHQELGLQGYEIADRVAVGCMIEVPSVLFLLERVIEEVDFLSVGTNDLVQYLLAVDRDNPWVSDLYDPQHPAVLRALAEIASWTSRLGKHATVCGDLATDPAMAVLLMGLGYDGVSIAPQFVPEVKFAVRRIRADAARRFAEQALAGNVVADVRAVVDAIHAELVRTEDAEMHAS